MTASENNSAQLRRDYTRVALAGTKKVVDDNGRPLLDAEQAAALGRLISAGLAAQEHSVVVLRRPEDANVELNEETTDVLETLFTLWLRSDADLAGDEVLYGELGYWQHWWNVLNDGTDRVKQPLKMDLLIADDPSFTNPQWAGELDQDIMQHVFSNKLLDARMIVPPSTLGSQIESLVEQLIVLGVKVRVLPSRFQFVVYDQVAAVIKDDSAPHKIERHRLTRHPAMVEPLQRLFSLQWAAAIPWAGFSKGTSGILHLLAQGWTDQRIADVTGVSTRTVSRRISEVMDAAGAMSRFELGMKYALSKLGRDAFYKP